MARMLLERWPSEFVLPAEEVAPLGLELGQAHAVDLGHRGRDRVTVAEAHQHGAHGGEPTAGHQIFGDPEGDVVPDARAGGVRVADEGFEAAERESTRSAQERIDTDALQVLGQSLLTPARSPTTRQLVDGSVGVLVNDQLIERGAGRQAGAEGQADLSVVQALYPA